MRPDLGHTVRAQRLSLLAAALVVGFLGLFLRSFELQVVQAEDLRAKQRRQSARQIRLPALRGDIVDREGVLLATTVIRYEILAENAKLTTPERKRIVREVSRITHERREKLMARLRSDKPLVQLAYGVSESQVKDLHRADLPHLSYEPRLQRSYPSRGIGGNTLAGAFIGFAGVDGRALSGIELAYDAALTGNAVTLQIQKDGRGRRILRSFSPARERQGETLRLTLDSRLQFEAERALAAALEQSGARTGSLIALDPRNGDVLAAAEAPGFDQNHFWRESDERFRAHIFQDGFEPGSTLKPFVVATALELGAITKDEKFDCGRGRLRVKDRVIRDTQPHDHLNAADALRVSSNICLARIAERLGSESLVSGLRALGFGRRTRSPFPGETQGVLHDLRNSQDVERANLAFGQGMQASPLQLALAGAALARGGRRIQPRLVLEIGDDPAATGETRTQILSPDTAASVLEMLREVVENGTGRAAALDHFSVAGKTGTAQKIVNGAYSHDAFVTSFLGITPVEDPRLVVVVVLDEPSRNKSGGTSAAPAFKQFAETALMELEVVARVDP